MAEDDVSNLTKDEEEAIRDQAREEVRRALRGKKLPAPNSAIRLDFVEAFVAAADHSTLKEAADSLSITEETLRKRVNAFERWSSTTLFQRRPYLLMTLDAAELLPLARQMCTLLQQMQGMVRAWQVRSIRWPGLELSGAGGMRRVIIDGEPRIEVD